MTIQSVVDLLKDYEKELLQERRAADRKPFVRPVTIFAGKNQDEIHEAFSRDISPLGVCLVSKVNWRDQARALLRIDSLKGKTLSLQIMSCWSRPYVREWFLTGWKFYGEVK